MPCASGRRVKYSVELQCDQYSVCLICESVFIDVARRLIEDAAGFLPGRARSAVAQQRLDAHVARIIRFKQASKSICAVGMLSGRVVVAERTA